MRALRILLDHDVPHPLRHHFPEGYDVYTAGFMGWADLEDRALVEAAARAGFGVLVTIDKNLGFQQNLVDAPIGLLFLRTHPAKMSTLTALMPAIAEALPVVAEGRHVTVYRP